MTIEIEHARRRDGVLGGEHAYEAGERRARGARGSAACEVVQAGDRVQHPALRTVASAEVALQQREPCLPEAQLGRRAMQVGEVEPTGDRRAGAQCLGDRRGVIGGDQAVLAVAADATLADEHDVLGERCDRACDRFAVGAVHDDQSAARNGRVGGHRPVLDPGAFVERDRRALEGVVGAGRLRRRGAGVRQPAPHPVERVVRQVDQRPRCALACGGPVDVAAVDPQLGELDEFGPVGAVTASAVAPRVSAGVAGRPSAGQIRGAADVAVLGSPVEEGAEGDREVGRACRDDGEPLAKRLPSDLQRPREVGEAKVPRAPGRRRAGGSRVGGPRRRPRRVRR